MLARAVGDVQLCRILESEAPNFDPLVFFPDTTAGDWQPYRHWLSPHPRGTGPGLLTMTMQAWLVRTRHHNILVDTCVGDGKVRRGLHAPPEWHLARGGALLRSLAQAGLGPQDIDCVVCTHLHSDHVGWNTRLEDGRWVPTFPRARYVMSARELAHWQAVHRDTPLVHLDDSVLPVVAAGQAELVADDHAVDDAVRLEPAPGHTPHHVAVRIDSGGAGAVITGDLMHSPVQVWQPHWRVRFDHDAGQAVRTRLDFLAQHAEANTLVCGTHFPSPSFGHVRAAGGGFRFEALAS
jgi:glyoxylase-like metal-dependent hydrolase (beta-lactamase superfamily II)